MIKLSRYHSPFQTSYIIYEYRELWLHVNIVTFLIKASAALVIYIIYKGRCNLVQFNLEKRIQFSFRKIMFKIKKKKFKMNFLKLL